MMLKHQIVDSLFVLEAECKTKPRNEASSGARRRRRRRRLFLQDLFYDTLHYVDELVSGGIQYLPRAEWVAEPNGKALKSSCKKGLVK